MLNRVLFIKIINLQDYATRLAQGSRTTFFIQSEAKPTPRVTCLTYYFFRARVLIGLLYCRCPLLLLPSS